MSASEAGGAAPHALAMTIRSNNFAPRPIPQPSTETQRNPLVNCSRDIVWLPSRLFALVTHQFPGKRTRKLFGHLPAAHRCVINLANANLSPGIDSPVSFLRN